jgi:hypothetical protein
VLDQPPRPFRGSTGDIRRVLAGPERRQTASSSLAYSRYAALLRPCLATFWQSPELGSVVVLIGLAVPANVAGRSTIR